MTAHTLSNVSPAASVHPLFARRSASQPHGMDHGAAPKQVEAQRISADRAASESLSQGCVALLLEQLFELLPQGVVVLSTTQQQVVYWNLTAQHLCRDAFNSKFPEAPIPTALLDICHRLQRQTPGEPTPVVMDYPTDSVQVVRARARWLHLNAAMNDALAWGRSAPARSTGQLAFAQPIPSDSLIVVFLEDRQQTQAEDLYLQKQMYDFTDRETEIWTLLQQDYSYQEIAKTLQISLNTVKTHVKNIYAKRRGYTDAIAC